MRGSLLDIIFIVFIAMFLFTVVVVTFMFSSVVNDRLQTLDVMTPEAKNALNVGVGSMLIWDQALFLLIAGLMLASIISAAFLRTHPVFFIASIIALILFIIIGAHITNFYLEILGYEPIADYSNQFPIMIKFFQNIPMIILGFSVVVIIVMYAFGGRNENYI